MTWEKACFAPQNGQKVAPMATSFPQFAQNAKILQVVAESLYNIKLVLLRAGIVAGNGRCASARS